MFMFICPWTCHLHWLKNGILSSVVDFDWNDWLLQTSPDVLPKYVSWYSGYILLNNAIIANYCDVILLSQNITVMKFMMV